MSTYPWGITQVRLPDTLPHHTEQPCLVTKRETDTNSDLDLDSTASCTNFFAGQQHT